MYSYQYDLYVLYLSTRRQRWHHLYPYIAYFSDLLIVSCAVCWETRGVATDRSQLYLQITQNNGRY